MCSPNRNSPELEIYATVIHTTGMNVNFMGLIYNARRGNWRDILFHGIGFVYHTTSALHHFKQLKRKKDRLDGESGRPLGVGVTVSEGDSDTPILTARSVPVIHATDKNYSDDLEWENSWV